MIQVVVENLNSFLDSGKRLFIAQSGINTNIQTQQADPIQSNIYEFLSKYSLQLQKNLVLDAKCGNVQVQERRGIFLMNRPMEYPFFPVVDSFNTSEIVVSDLEQVLPFFPSEIKIDTLDNEKVAGAVPLFSSSNNNLATAVLASHGLLGLKIFFLLLKILTLNDQPSSSKIN